MFSYVTLEQRVPQDHPLREIRRITDVVLRSLSGEFDGLYSASGRPSIAPEYVLRALLLQAFYSVRSERQLVEQLDYNLLFRWFVGLGMDDAVWNHAVFSKNRDRLLTSEVAQQFFAAVNRQAKRFMSDDHFTVDGTLIQAWASQKSFRKKDGSDDDGADFHDQKRSNDTHESTTDPDAREVPFWELPSLARRRAIRKTTSKSSEADPPKRRISSPRARRMTTPNLAAIRGSSCWITRSRRSSMDILCLCFWQNRVYPWISMMDIYTSGIVAMRLISPAKWYFRSGTTTLLHTLGWVLGEISRKKPQ